MNFENSPREDAAADESVTPKFGLIDLIDAFTALRHEYRSQVKESRQLLEMFQQLSGILEGITKSTKLEARPAGAATEHVAGDALRWIKLLIEFDIQWTRAIEVVSRQEDAAQKETQQMRLITQQVIASLTPWQRWWASPLSAKLLDRVQTLEPTKTGYAEGLLILLSRLRNTLSELRVERIETLGTQFDGELMRSIGTMTNSQYPAGYVAEQFSPAYRWGGVVVKFADVRVAAAG
jgi:hypothetical protein